MLESMINKVMNKKDKNTQEGIEIARGADTLVVFAEDKRTSDIVSVSDVSDEAVITRDYVVPREDCEVTVGPKGRVFFYRAPQQSVESVEGLARLEQSMVLNQITSYRAPDVEKPMDFTKMALFFIILVMVMVLAFK